MFFYNISFSLRYWCRVCYSEPSEHCRNKSHELADLDVVRREARSRLRAVEEDIQTAKDALAEAERDHQSAQEELRALAEAVAETSSTGYSQSFSKKNEVETHKLLITRIDLETHLYKLHSLTCLKANATATILLLLG